MQRDILQPESAIAERGLMGTERSIGVLGARSLVGGFLLRRLAAAGEQVVAFTRQDCSAEDRRSSPKAIAWHSLAEQQLADTVNRAGVDNCRVESAARSTISEIPNWVSLAPIWVLPSYFSMFEACGARRIVVLSSTSRYSKLDSADRSERKLANELADSERLIVSWAEKKGIQWIILRPTLIYDLGSDRNISEIATFIRRFGFFPLFGAAQGRRQPVHADDVASACVAALLESGVRNRDYVLSGGEVLSYRDMVGRVFRALGRSERFVTVPLWAFRFAIAGLSILPRFRHWSVGMAERMNRDLVFGHDDAARDLGFTPRGFQPMSNESPN